jgi:hypothetical protein
MSAVDATIGIQDLSVEERACARAYAWSEGARLFRYGVDVYEAAYREYATAARDGATAPTLDEDVGVDVRLRMRDALVSGDGGTSVRSKARLFGSLVMEYAPVLVRDVHDDAAHRFHHVSYDSFRQVRYMLYVMHTENLYDQVVRFMIGNSDAHAAQGTVSEFRGMLDVVQYCQAYYWRHYGSEARAQAEDSRHSKARQPAPALAAAPPLVAREERSVVLATRAPAVFGATYTTSDRAPSPLAPHAVLATAVVRANLAGAADGVAAAVGSNAGAPHALPRLGSGFSAGFGRGSGPGADPDSLQAADALVSLTRGPCATCARDKSVCCINFVPALFIQNDPRG